MAARHRPDAVSRWILQRICFLPQGIEVADSHGRDYQHRIEQDARALANGDEAHWHVLSSRADILWHAAAAIAAAAEGKGSVRKNPLLATRARFAQSWPVFRVPWRRSHQEDVRTAGLLKLDSVRLAERISVFYLANVRRLRGLV